MYFNTLYNVICIFFQTCVQEDDTDIKAEKNDEEREKSEVSRLNKVRTLSGQNDLANVSSVLETPVRQNNNAPAIATVWGEKLLTLEPQQKLFAEKAINDILFEAELGNLNRYSVKINENQSR